jgi:hypothetical protein
MSKLPRMNLRAAKLPGDLSGVAWLFGITWFSVTWLSVTGPTILCLSWVTRVFLCAAAGIAAGSKSFPNMFLQQVDFRLRL